MQIARVERTLLSAAFDVAFGFDFWGAGGNQNQHQKRRTRVSVLHRRKLAALEALKKSLVHQAFTGQL